MANLLCVVYAELPRVGRYPDARSVSTSPERELTPTAPEKHEHKRQGVMTPRGRVCGFGHWRPLVDTRSLRLMSMRRGPSSPVAREEIDHG
jgi:hypothetical protein